MAKKVKTRSNFLGLRHIANSCSQAWGCPVNEVIMARRLLALLAAVLVSTIPTRAEDEPARKLRIVVFGGHPDDPESGAGGLIATLTGRGHEVICAYGTAFRGDRRFFDRPEAEVRRAEATAACEVLGATPKFFPYAHETLQADEPTLKEVSDWIGEVKPGIVVTHWPLDTHPNRHVVSSLAWRCCQRQSGWNLYGDLLTSPGDEERVARMADIPPECTITTGHLAVWRGLDQVDPIVVVISDLHGPSPLATRSLLVF
jgi:LmbE family N-acetylglucosaminyl deacetylase